MGYDLHITRKSFWADEVGPVITVEEWLAYVDTDQTLTPDPRNGPYMFLWNGPSKYEEPWIEWNEGELYTKNPDPPLIGKLLEIAAALDAKVRGDDNEVYTSPTEYFHEPDLSGTQGCRPTDSSEESAPRPATEPERGATRPKMPTPYIVLRAWVFLFGLVLLALDVLTSVLDSGESVFDPGRGGFWILFHWVMRFAALSYLLPFRWGINTPVFHARVALAAAVLVRSMFVSTELARGVWGANHWIIWPLLAILVLSETTAVGLLFWRRNPAWSYRR